MTRPEGLVRNLRCAYVNVRYFTNFYCRHGFPLRQLNASLLSIPFIWSWYESDVDRVSNTGAKEQSLITDISMVRHMTVRVTCFERSPVHVDWMHLSFTTKISRQLCASAPNSKASENFPAPVFAWLDLGTSVCPPMWLCFPVPHP